METGRRRTLLACLALSAAVLAVYGGAVRHAFVDLDTRAYLTENAWVRRGLTAGGVRWAFTTFHAANWHPLTWLSHMLDVELFGLAPPGHQLENVLLHATNACLVFLLFQELTGAFGRSLFVAGLFALHPLHVESVAWIVERKDLLSALFGISSLLAWTAWTRKGGAVRYALALVAFAAGLASKPMLVTWPFVLLLLDRWPLERTSLGARRLCLEKLPWLALSIASAVVTVLAQSAGGAVRSLSTFPIFTRLSNAALAYATYLGKTFWPAGLVYHYPHAAADASIANIVLAFALLATMTVIALRSRRAPWLAFGWLWFLGTLVPVIGLVQVGWQGLADRYTYLPHLGIFVAVAWTAGAWFDARAALRPFAAEAACAVALALAISARNQVATWKDTEALCTHAIEVDPRNYAAHDLLGLDCLEKGDLARAEAEFEAASAIEPEDLVARQNLGRVLDRAGRHAEAEAVFRELAGVLETSAEVRRSLAIAIAAQGRREEALAELEVGVKSEPDYAPAHLAKGRILEELARGDEARAAYRSALEIEPSYTEARLALARAEARHGDFAAAELELRRAIEADPEEPEARRGLALVLLSERREAEALAAARAALDLRPDWALAMGDVAWILATTEDPSVADPRSAVVLAEEAVRRTQEKHAGVLDTLAAAYASAGEFDRAIETAEKAASLAAAGGDAALAERVARRLAAYREGRLDRRIPR